MGDTWNLYRSLVLSGIISMGMCQSGSVLVTAHGDRALGQQKAQVRAVCFLSLQNTPHPLPSGLLQQATQKHGASQIQEKELPHPHPLRPVWPLPGRVPLTWSKGPLDLQVLPHEALCCVAAVVIRQGGAAEAIGEGIRAGVPVRLQREKSLDQAAGAPLPRPSLTHRWPKTGCLGPHSPSSWLCS